MGHSKGGHFARFLGCVWKKCPIGGGDTFLFSVCVRPTKSVPPKKKGGGTLFQKGYDFFSGSAQVFLAVAT